MSYTFINFFCYLYVVAMSIQSLRPNVSAIFLWLKHKEFLLVLYFLLFIFGIANSSGYNFYNEYRIIQVALLLALGLWAVVKNQYTIAKSEWLFFIFIAVGSVFWQQPLFIIIDLFLAYLLFKGFQTLEYNELITKMMVLGSLVLFLMLPVALFDYVSSGTYIANWYPLSWNIRVYNSYFLILSVFATWFYIRDAQYKSLYLLFLFLAVLAVLLDAGRSVTLAYTAFVAVVILGHKPTRLPLIATYIASWLAYLAVTYTASFVGSDIQGIQIVRATTSLRYDLWMNAYHCWLQNPLIGCGFYQPNTNMALAAHPHNLFIQVLSETGVIGFGFLAFIMFKVSRHIRGSLKQNFFVIAALLAVAIDMSLSGIHIYPITQIALLWLFVFLFKNPAFAHALYFNQCSKLTTQSVSLIDRYLPMLVVFILILIFGYLFMTTNIFLEETPSTPPRFWGYGYYLL